MRSILGKVRSTVLEGSFGNEKNHYQMNKIKAKTEDNEKAWIFFSLLTCNAMQIAKRMQAAEKENSNNSNNSSLIFFQFEKLYGRSVLYHKPIP
jgi:hypothetical protein